MNKRKLLFIVLSIAWMVVIYSFSAKEGPESESMSNRVGQYVCKVFVKGFDDMSEARQEKLVKAIDYPIRKGAHMTEYCILSLLLAGVFVDIKPKKEMTKEKLENEMKYSLNLSFFTTVIYASTDEFHQLFVSDRGGRATDVLIDSVGAFVGTLVIFLILKRIINKASE